MVGVWWLHIGWIMDHINLLPVTVWHSQCALCRSLQTEERSGCVGHEPATMDTKASIPGLLPPQVASWCSSLHYPILQARKADGGHGLGSRVGMYVCHVTTGKMWLWILPVCTPLNLLHPPAISKVKAYSCMICLHTWTRIKSRYVCHIPTDFHLMWLWIAQQQPGMYLVQYYGSIASN